VVCLQQAVQIWTELFKFSLEDLAVLVGDGLLVEDENIRDIVVMRLKLV
jgi:hypothetical protein